MIIKSDKQQVLLLGQKRLNGHYKTRNGKRCGQQENRGEIKIDTDLYNDVFA